MAYRVGVDVGGTFTDVIMVSTATGETWRAKTSSTLADQAVGVQNGIRQVCRQAGADLSEIVEILHGTTVATNAVLEGKGATVGLITTRGFRQVLQIGRSYVPGGLAGWIIWPKPEPLAALENTVEVVERIGTDGSVVTALDESSVREGLRYLASRGVSSLAVALINSFANGTHERRIAEIAADIIPDISVSLSSDVLPELREYERTITTVTNSYVRPQVAKYISSLARELNVTGIDGNLSILRSDGGLAKANIAAESPVNMLMSGPAGGVTGAVWAARQCGVTDLITFDMGGTSSDIALVRALAPKIGRETRVGDLTVRASSIDIRTVGAGGGSIAHVPPLTGALRVGPESAGADPGPASYGKGGTEPTVTDANLVLGYLPDKLAGGEIELDIEAARRSIQPIAEAAGLADVESAAAGIIDIVNENMLGGLRLVTVQQGFDPRDFALVAFGGAGPLHANALGRLTGAWPVVIPPSPGVLCALGDATTSARAESARTIMASVSDLQGSRLLDVFAALRADAIEQLAKQGITEVTAEYEVDLRYHGQGFETPVRIDETWLGGAVDVLLTKLCDAFDAEHMRLFSFTLEADYEIINARVAVTAPQPSVVSGILPTGSGDISSALISSSEIIVGNQRMTAGVYDRKKLLAEDVISGPAIITEMDSTTLILPDHNATVHASGSLMIRPIEN